MKSVGIDLHKKSITVCVLGLEQNVLKTQRFACADTPRIDAFFASLGEFQAVVEATAGYEWLVQRIEPLARRVLLAHPGKMRIIAESACKSDRYDARVLAEFLAWGKIPQAYRPTPRQRAHRALVRHRQFLQRERTMVKNKVRRIVSDYNADRTDLFSKRGLEALAAMPLQPEDRFIVDQLLEQLRLLTDQRQRIAARLKLFAKEAPEAESRHRELLRSIPGVGEVTTEVVLAELGDVSRFRSARQVVAYAGLQPGRRQSDKKCVDLGITKRGSGLLRWVLVEASWQLVRRSVHWRSVYEKLKQRRGSRRSIVAVARRLLTVMVAMIREGVAYRESPGARVGPPNESKTVHP